MHSKNFSFTFNTNKEAIMVFNAVNPEIKKENYKRSKTSLKMLSKKLILNVTAKDATAFKASVNNYTKSIMLSKKIFNVLKEVKKCQN